LAVLCKQVERKALGWLNLYFLTQPNVNIQKCATQIKASDLNGFSLDEVCTEIQILRMASIFMMIW